MIVSHDIAKSMGVDASIYIINKIKNTYKKPIEQYNFNEIISKFVGETLSFEIVLSDNNQKLKILITQASILRDYHEKLIKLAKEDTKVITELVVNSPQVKATNLISGWKDALETLFNWEGVVKRKNEEENAKAQVFKKVHEELMTGFFKAFKLEIDSNLLKMLKLD